MTATDNPHRLFLVSVPRTASNLLVKVLDIRHQPDVFTNGKLGYYFYDVYMRTLGKGYFTKPFAEWAEDEKKEVRDLYQKCLDELEEASAQARRDNKIMFTKEHAFWFVNPAVMVGADTTSDRAQFQLSLPDGLYSQQATFSADNKTLFSDEYLRTWQWAFIIRHPALAWPSMYRAMQKMNKLGLLDEDGITGSVVTNMTWQWSRRLVDWCTAQHAEFGTPLPLIIDAHDVIHNRDAVLRFCERAGLDTATVQFEWDDESKKDYTPMPRQAAVDSKNSFQFNGHDKEVADIMTGTLRKSTGLIKDKTPAAVDIDAEAEKWKEEFGIEAAALLEKLVRESMSDYEYLREKRVTV